MYCIALHFIFGLLEKGSFVCPCLTSAKVHILSCFNAILEHPLRNHTCNLASVQRDVMCKAPHHLCAQGISMQHLGNSEPSAAAPVAVPTQPLPAPLQANTFTDVLASVAAQWSPPNEELLGSDWGNHAQMGSMVEESGSAHGGNYFMVLLFWLPLCSSNSCHWQTLCTFACHVAASETWSDTALIHVPFVCTFHRTH